MNLNDEWIWRYHVKDKNKSYEDNTKEICSFKSIENFWRYYNNIPKPTEFFKLDNNFKKINNKNIHAWSIFRKGIEPAWEDKMNIKGDKLTTK